MQWTTLAAAGNSGSLTCNGVALSVDPNAPAFSAQQPLPFEIGDSYFSPYTISNSPTGFAVSSGALPAGFGANATYDLISAPRDTAPAVGSYTFTLAATNSAGTTASPTQTLIVTYRPRIIGQPVVGVPTRFTVPGYYDSVDGPSGTFGSIQWYRNTASDSVGWRIIPGATSLTYTPVSGDDGFFLSVHVTIGGVPYNSLEWASFSSVISQTGVLRVSATLGDERGVSYGKVSSGLTLSAPTLVRYCIDKSGQTYYVDTLLAPGTYPASGAQFGDLTLLNAYGAASNPNLRGMAAMGPAAVITPLTDSAPATATRPAYNTGVGFFVANGRIYDANGNRFTLCGINQAHYNSSASGAPNTGANCMRVFTYMDNGNGWSTGTPTNQSIMQGLIGNSMVPIPVIAHAVATYTASITGDTMTVTSITGAIPISGTTLALVTPTVTVPNLLVPCVKSYGTATNKTGTYILRVPGVTTATAMSTGTSSAANPACKFTATIDGANGVLTVSSMTVGNTQSINVGDFIWISGATAASITSFGTGTGGTGTYNFAVNLNLPSQTFTTSLPGSGDQSASTMDCAAQYWVDAASNWKTIERYSIINIINEWGPTDTTVWRDSALAAVQKMRTAGYTGLIMIDAPGSGQDPASLGHAGTIIRDSGYIFANDPQKNVVISLHVYGVYRPGELWSVAQQMASVTSSTGVPFVIGEFGPDILISVLGSRTLEDQREIMAVASAANLSGWISWAWDDHINDNDSNGTSDSFYAMAKNSATGGYNTSDPTQLTRHGKRVVLDPYWGIAAKSVKATCFP